MNHDAAPTPECGAPSLFLKEGVDYADDPELHARIMEELENLGIEPDRVLLSGYGAPIEDVGPDFHTSTFAMTAEDARRAAEGNLLSSPYGYARDAASPRRKSIIAAYDQNCFIPMEEEERYLLKPGLLMGDATFMTFELTS